MNKFLIAVVGGSYVSDPKWNPMDSFKESAVNNICNTLPGWSFFSWNIFIESYVIIIRGLATVSQPQRKVGILRISISSKMRFHISALNTTFGFISQNDSVICCRRPKSFFFSSSILGFKDIVIHGHSLYSDNFQISWNFTLQIHLLKHLLKKMLKLTSKELYNLSSVLHFHLCIKLLKVSPHSLPYLHLQKNIFATWRNLGFFATKKYLKGGKLHFSGEVAGRKVLGGNVTIIT